MLYSDDDSVLERWYLYCAPFSWDVETNHTYIVEVASVIPKVVDQFDIIPGVVMEEQMEQSFNINNMLMQAQVNNS